MFAVYVNWGNVDSNELILSMLGGFLIVLAYKTYFLRKIDRRLSRTHDIFAAISEFFLGLNIVGRECLSGEYVTLSILGLVGLLFVALLEIYNLRKEVLSLQIRNKEISKSQ